MSGTATAAFPTGPLLEADGSLSSAWRGFFVALYARTGAATGTPTGATQTALDAEMAARIAGDHNLQAQIDSISGSVAAGAANAVIMKSGRSASDSGALVMVTFPTPYTTRTLSFAVDGSPMEPGVFFSQSGATAGGPDVMTTSLVTGQLMKIDIPSGTTVLASGIAFTWYATGV